MLEIFVQYKSRKNKKYKTGHTYNNNISYFDSKLIVEDNYQSLGGQLKYNTRNFKDASIVNNNKRFANILYDIGTKKSIFYAQINPLYTNNFYNHTELEFSINKHKRWLLPKRIETLIKQTQNYNN